MPLFDTLQSDLNAARKAQDKARVLVLSTIFSDVKNKDVMTAGRVELGGRDIQEAVVG